MAYEKQLLIYGRKKEMGHKKARYWEKILKVSYSDPSLGM